MNELTKYNKLNDKIIESEEIIKLIEARYSVLKKKFELEKFSTKEEFKTSDSKEFISQGGTITSKYFFYQKKL